MFFVLKDRLFSNRENGNAPSIKADPKSQLSINQLFQTRKSRKE
jgi:hypothetical protein